MRYIFNHDDYYHTFKGQLHHGPSDHQRSYQSGDGFGSILRGLGRYVLPVVKRYVLPHGKNALLSTISDIAENGDSNSVKQALKKRGLGLIRNIGTDLAKSVLTRQTGAGISSRTARGRHTGTTVTKTSKRSSQLAAKSRNPKKKNSKRSKLDIFS